MDRDGFENETQTDITEDKISWGRMSISLGIIIALPAVILFSAAGRLDWTWGWLYVILTAVFTVASRLIVVLKTPELAAERGKSLQQEDVKPWDRVILPLTFITPIIMFIIAGLDDRFGWSPGIPLAVHGIGMTFTAAGYFLSSWAMVVNRFFSASVRIQAERGHTVVSAGPYRFIRHPGYAGSILSTAAIPLLLGTLWALVPALLAIIFLGIRTGLEDKTLQNELEGYREYVAAVRYRLLPGVW